MILPSSIFDLMSDQRSPMILPTASWNEAALSFVLALQRSSVLRMMSMMASTSALDWGDEGGHDRLMYLAFFSSS